MRRLDIHIGNFLYRVFPPYTAYFFKISNKSVQITLETKDLREWNPRRSDHHVLLITSSGIQLSQISVC